MKLVSTLVASSLLLAVMSPAFAEVTAPAAAPIGATPPTASPAMESTPKKAKHHHKNKKKKSGKKSTEAPAAS